MDKKELASLISVKSGVNADDCLKVLDAFEEVFSDELADKKWKGSLFSAFFGMMGTIKNKKDKKEKEN